MSPSNRANFIVRVTGTAIPANPETQDYAGFEALRKCDGKTYQAFRDQAGGKKGEPLRRFSPSTVMRLAEQHGFAHLEPPRPI